MNRLCFKLITILIFSLFSITSFSQGGPNFWAINGNVNTTAGTNFLGTTNNQAIDFRTFGIQRMRLTEAGRLGLGTTTPLSLFEINGTALGMGNVFSTDAPNVTTTWSMSRGGNLVGNIFFQPC